MKLEEENPNGFRLSEPDQCAANRVLGTVQNQIHPGLLRNWPLIAHPHQKIA